MRFISNERYINHISYFISFNYYSRKILETIMLLYIMIAIGALWGIITLVALREEEKEIKELIDSARKANQERRGLK
jgi:protein-S-isoprenylcysteine O-methyltransferase Ste14